MAETNRYIRNMQLAGFGAEAQQMLLASTALVVGCGALGTVASMYLAGAGVGHIVLVDFDNIDITNLQRQLAFTEQDLGCSKAETLAAKLIAINSGISVEVHRTLLRGELARQLIGECDIVMECTDNPDSKYLVTDIATDLGKPYVIGGVAQFQGQVMAWQAGCAGYRDVFPVAADADGYMPCSVGGVFSPLPGIIASIQAAEAIKILTGIGTPLTNRLLLYDSASAQCLIMRVEPSESRE